MSYAGTVRFTYAKTVEEREVDYGDMVSCHYADVVNSKVTRASDYMTVMKSRGGPLLRML